MSIVNPQVVALARVNVFGGFKERLPSASYEFSNGFETGNVPGASIGAAPIYWAGDGSFVLFLNEPVDAGSRALQGGIKVRADVVNVSTLNDPSSDFPPTVKTMVQCSDFGLFGTPYQNVDPRKAIRVSLYAFYGSYINYNGSAVFDIVVVSDPMVSFAGKVSEAK